MNEFKALLVAQALLQQWGSRLKLKEFHSAGEGYYRFRVQGRRGLSPKVVMPVVSQTNGLAVLSLLDETNSANRSWLINGQPCEGFKMLAHYGHSGMAVCKRSKADMLELLGSDLESLTAASRSILDAAPENETLEVYGFEQELLTFVLPADEEVSAICRALKGEQVIVTESVDRYKAIKDAFGLGLAFVAGGNQVLMLNREQAKAANKSKAA